MSRKVNKEEVILNYFTDTDLGGANVTFNFVSSLMKKRNAGAPKPTAAAAAPKAAKKAKVVPAAVVQEAGQSLGASLQDSEL